MDADSVSVMLGKCIRVKVGRGIFSVFAGGAVEMRGKYVSDGKVPSLSFVLKNGGYSPLCI